MPKRRERTLRLNLDLDRVRDNTLAIGAATKRPVWAVVKADAYGLGARRVVQALAECVEGFCTFSLAEAIDADIHRLAGRPTLTIGPPDTLDISQWTGPSVYPAVSTIEQAEMLRSARCEVCVDTGMSRFTCPPQDFHAICEAGTAFGAFTHATRIEHVERFLTLTAGATRRLARHAAGSSLLHEPRAWLDRVRPGLALYTGAVAITATLAEVHESRGPIGYRGFTAARHGVIFAGYRHGLRRGPCRVGGRLALIPEVGMQSAYIDLSGDGEPIGADVGDEVTLLGPELPPEVLARSWDCSPHEALLRLANGARLRSSAPNGYHSGHE